MDFPARSFLLLCAVATTAFGAAPVIDPPVPTPNQGVIPVLPVGKTLIFPITATDADGDALTYKVTSSNPKVLVRAKTGNPAMRLTVSYGAGQSGEMVFFLFRDWTPVTSGFLSGFAQSGFFNNVEFHRVVKNFVIQGGDPLGTGQGGPGMTGNVPSTAFKFENELQPGLIFTGRGQLAMANSGYASDYTATNGSQFFVTLEQLHVPTEAHQVNLDFKHTVFGQMLSGWNVLDAIANVAVDANSKPTTPVRITAATIEPNLDDAVLMISATGRVPAATPATITVTATDGSGGSSTQTFTVSTFDDTSNSPPVVQNLSPLTTPQATQLDFPLQSFDLEFDYLFLNHGLLGISAANAASTSQGGVAAVLGNPGFAGQVRMGFEISQFNMGVGSAEPPVVQNLVPIGIGDRPLRPTAVTVKSAPGLGMVNVVVARFKDLDPAGSPTDLTNPATNTTINWGDGSPVQNGTVARDPAVPGPGNYVVTGSHTYSQAGIYTIVVNATGNLGAVGIARNSAIISAGPIVAVGQQIDVKGATASNRILATFTDTTPGRASEYTATVNWGDGVSSKGSVSKQAGNNFVVRGTHVYRDAEPFAISVVIEKAGSPDAVAWSTANVTGFTPPRHLPPFPQVHLVGAWNSGPSKRVTSGLAAATLDPATLSEALTGAFVVFNSGNKSSAVSKLRFLLSSAPLAIASFTAASPTVITTAAVHGLTTGDEVSISGVAGGSFAGSINGNLTATVISATSFSVPVACTNASVTTLGTVFSRKAALTGATQLMVNGLKEISVASFKAGAGGSGEFTITLPKPTTGTGRYLLAQLVYSDPIIDASRVEKVLITGPLAGVYVFNTTAELGVNDQGFLLIREDAKKGTFQVVLDTAPTANVTVALQSSAVAEGTVSPASLTFTPANWNTAQTVTVTGVDDATKDGNKSFTVTVKEPVSTDSRYSGTAATSISFLNLDND